MPKPRLAQSFLVKAWQRGMEPAASETQISSFLPQQKSSSYPTPGVINSCFQTESGFLKLEHKNNLSPSTQAECKPLRMKGNGELEKAEYSFLFNPSKNTSFLNPYNKQKTCAAIDLVAKKESIPQSVRLPFLLCWYFSESVESAFLFLLTLCTQSK